MKAHLVIATKGRPDCLPHLFERIAHQTLRPATVVVVGCQESDVSPIVGRSLYPETTVQVVLSSRPGLCLQRNLGLSAIGLDAETDEAGSEESFVVFFDDDFRPAADWLAGCSQLFTEERDVVALTGRILADGVHGSLIAEGDVDRYLTGELPTHQHWASGSARDLDCMYGCNMAFRSVVFAHCRFDENLPLYGWQEDQDITSQARRLGRTMFHPECRGVHLGSPSARVSGLRFGYSQIANPLYLVNKGTMARRKTTRFLVKHLLSNSLRSLTGARAVDYPGRLRGNALAVTDLMFGRCHPTRILEL